MNLDKFFTNVEIAEKCCELVKKTINIDYKKDFVIEPSAGSGSFIKPIKDICKNHLFIDIQPEHPDVNKQDYLKMNPKFFRTLKKLDKIHVIGNPPFGFKGSNAIKFIRHSCEFCDTFSFILPLSFAKSSMKKTIPLNFHLLASYNIPPNSFHYSKNMYDIPCIFQIWERKKYDRKVDKKLLPNGYRFVKKVSDADFAIRRVGSYAGKIIDIQNNPNSNSHYFVKLNDKMYMKKIKDINIRSNNYVAGPRSISKRDIIKNMNQMIDIGTL